MGIQNAVIANSTLGLSCENVTPAHLADITFLDVSSRGIERLSAGDLAGLTNMVKLDLGGNRIKTISEDLFEGLTNLEIIYIDGSELTGLPENLFNELTSLEELVLNSNSLSSLPEDLFDGLISLERLDIDNNKLTNLHEDQFDGLTELRHLDLQHNDLASLDRHLFDGLTELIALNIFENKLISLDKELFDGLTNLEQLIFSFNNLSRLPKDLFDGLTSLEWLDMGNNKLINLHKDQFGGLTSLRHLDMGDNKLINLHKDQFDGLSRLEWLNFDHNSLTSLDKDIFDGLSRLKDLHLGRNSLADLHEDLFDELTSLESLYLFENLLTSLPDNLFAYKVSSPRLSVNLLENDIACFPYSIINNGYIELIHPNKDKSCILTPTVRLVLSEATILEAGGQTELTATLDIPSGEVTRISLTVDPPPPADYEVDTVPLVLTIAAGETVSGAITIMSVDNVIDESARTFTITGISTENVIGPEAIMFTIEDDEEMPTVTLVLSEARISEAGGQTELMAVLDRPSGVVTTVTITSDLSPAADYEVNTSLVLTIAAGETVSRGITITAVDNAVDAPDKAFTITSTSENALGVLGPSSIILTITDDDMWGSELGLILEPASISEGGEFSRVTAVLDVPFPTPLTVEIAADGSVLLSSNRMLQIAAGEIESTGEVTVRAVDNEMDEPDREVGILGSSSELGSASALLTIEDDDAVPRATLHLSPNPIGEGGEVSRVTARLTHPSSAGTTIVVSAASADSDLFFLSPNKTLTIAAGQRESSGLVTIISGDNAQHGLNAMVTVMGEAANEQGIQGPAATTLRITDDERPTVSLHLSDTFISENGGTTTVTARLDSPVSTDLSILLSGDPVSDYVFLMDGVITTSPMLTIVGGERISRERVTIRAMDNAVYGPVTKAIVISGTSSGDVNRIDRVRFTITDDEEAPSVDIALTPGRISENGGIAVLRARLSHRSSTDLPVMVSATPSASSYEWMGPSVLTIPAGHTESRREVMIRAVNNDVHDLDQTIIFQGTVVNPDVVSPIPAVLTIEDDEGVPTATLHVSRNPIPEAGGSTTVTATLSHGSSFPTTITVTALPRDPTLFTLSEFPTLTIAAKETRSTGRLTLRAVDNAEYGLDQVVTISGIAHNSLGITGPAPVLLTILDDELAPLVLSIYDTRIREDESVARLSVELNRPTDQVVTVQYQTFDQSAEASTDYTASGGMVVFAPQATRGVIQIGILADGIPEEAETFGVKLLHPRHAGIRRGVGTVTIEEAATIPSLRIHGISAVGQVQFQVSLSHASSELITVRYRTEDGTAKAGRDYIPSSGVLTFLPGQIKAVVGVALLGSDRSRETFSMHLLDSEHAEITKSVAVVTVREAEVGQVMAAYRPRFVRSTSVQIVEAVVERFRSGADGSACGAGGRADLAQLWPWRPSLGELISGCRVSKSTGALGVWGRGAFRRFHGQSEVSLGASVSTAMVGADYRWNARWTVGLALAHSRGDGSYDRHPHAGAIASGLTGMYPYVGYWGRGMEVWMTGGYGWGTVRVPDLETDLAAGFGAMGVRGRVRRGLSYQGDVLYAEATGGGGDVYRIRLGMEGMFHLHEGIYPYVEAHMRQDGGSAETGIGLEVGGGVRVTVPSWQFKGDLRSQGVLVHSATGFQEWGISGSLQYGGGSRGILVRFRPSWGRGPGMTTYHSPTILDAVPRGRALDQTEVEVGYGVAFRSGEARSIMGITRRSEGAMLRLGGELRPEKRLRVSIFGLAHAMNSTLQPLGLHVNGTLQY